MKQWTILLISLSLGALAHAQEAGHQLSYSYGNVSEEYCSDLSAGLNSNLQKLEQQKGWSEGALSASADFTTRTSGVRQNIVTNSCVLILNSKLDAVSFEVTHQEVTDDMDQCAAAATELGNEKGAVLTHSFAQGWVFDLKCEANFILVSIH